MYPCRSTEAPGGAAAHGRVAQSGDAKEEGDATQVFALIRIVWLLIEIDVSHPDIL